MVYRKTKRVRPSDDRHEVRVTFRSGFEKMIWNHCLDRGLKVEYEPKDGVLSYNKPSTYLPDFRLPNGILIETKGYFSSQDRAKLIRVRRDNPNADIRLVFQRATNRLTKSPNSMTYGEWCDKHGFQWEQGHIPEEWFNE